MARAKPRLRLFGIEAGRGIAALLVVCFHVSRHLDNNIGYPIARTMFSFGHAGVDFFFVISGFLILFIHGDDIGCPDRLGHYAERRFTRIFPTYWVALGAAVAIGFLFHPNGFTLGDVAANALVLPPALQLIVGVAWTLKHELLFYLVFVSLILNRAVGLSILALWLAVFVAATLINLSFLPLTIRNFYNIEFFFGMAAAWRLRQGKVAHARLFLATGVFAFAAASMTEIRGLVIAGSPISILAYGLPSAFIVLGLVQIERDQRLFVPRILRLMGKSSYSIYLFHLLCIGIFYKLWQRAGLLDEMPLPISFIALVAAGLIGGTLISITIEYPLMACARALLSSNYRKRNRPIPTQDSVAPQIPRP